jgi:fatty acid desaturase
MDLGLLSSYEWRITHALSHHPYTNTVIDYELAVVEPFVDYRVYETKSILHRSKVSFFYGAVILPLIFPSQLIKRFINVGTGQQKLRPENFLPLIELFVMAILCNGFVPAFKLWLTIHSACSLCFLFIGVTTAHHHPDMFHAGDGEFRYGLDWGLAQLDATGDCKDVTGSLVAELTLFGNHILHHLFPTLDHGLLDSLRPVLEQTCADFNLPQQLAHTPAYNQHELLIGNLQQLARTQPRNLFELNNNNTITTTTNNNELLNDKSN